MSLFLQCGQGAMLKRLGRMFEATVDPKPEPRPEFSGTAVAPQQLTKTLMKANDETTWVSLIAALGDDSTFKKLVRREANAGRYQLAEVLLSMLTIVETPGASPSRRETSATELVEALRAELVSLAGGVASAALPLSSGAEELSKPLIKQGGQAAVNAAVAALAAETPLLRRLARKELELQSGRLLAAQRLAGSFKLAAPFPSEAEIMTAIQAELAAATPTDAKIELSKATIRKVSIVQPFTLSPTLSPPTLSPPPSAPRPSFPHPQPPDPRPPLPSAPPTLSPPTHQGGIPALNAVLHAFASDATFESLARKNVSESLSAYVSRPDVPYASIEEAETQIEREIATKLIASFKLASPSPTAAECKVALVAELEAMSAEALRID